MAGAIPCPPPDAKRDRVAREAISAHRMDEFRGEHRTILLYGIRSLDVSIRQERQNRGPNCNAVFSGAARASMNDFVD
jgi:hypothetical protein